MNLNKDEAKKAAQPFSLIKNVWKYNVEHEFMNMSKLVDEGFCYLSMDTEFPGIIYSYPIDKGIESGYRMLKQNVDALKLIQVGLTLSNKRGEKPAEVNTWQFNISFNFMNDQYNPESISILREAGINFEEMAEHGIDPMVFGDLLMTSGMIINNEVIWVAFHGTYDFAYLLKILMNDQLPNTSEEFAKYILHCFPNIYDIKTIINDIDEWKQFSLSKLGMELCIKRQGQCHQAGSDALLTIDIFFAICKNQFPRGIPSKYHNKIFGLHNEGGFSSYAPEQNLGGFPSFQFNYHSQFPNYTYYLPEQFNMGDYYQQSQNLNTGFIPPGSRLGPRI